MGMRLSLCDSLIRRVKDALVTVRELRDFRWHLAYASSCDVVHAAACPDVGIRYQPSMKWQP